jgi:hypothetical protein
MVTQGTQQAKLKWITFVTTICCPFQLIGLKNFTFKSLIAWAHITLSVIMLLSIVLILVFGSDYRFFIDWMTHNPFRCMAWNETDTNISGRLSSQDYRHGKYQKVCFSNFQSCWFSKRIHKSLCMNKAFSGTSAGTAHTDIYIQSTCKYINKAQYLPNK